RAIKRDYFRRQNLVDGIGSEVEFNVSCSRCGLLKVALQRCALRKTNIAKNNRGYKSRQT
ncbi:MAG: hypothetical protein ACJASY_003577, partial [Halioglobus sp.]